MASSSRVPQGEVIIDVSLLYRKDGLISLSFSTVDHITKVCTCRPY
jgi:hypothetical protein